MHIIHNARIQLLANLLNAMAGTSFAVGVATPIAAVFFYRAAPPGLRIGAVAAGIVIWLAVAAALHFLGRLILGGLRDEQH